MTRSRNPESILTEQLKSLLRIMHIFFWKNWSGTFSQKGIPDLLGVLPGGRAMLIEVKTPTGRVSPEQEDFLARAREAGAVAFVARSPRDLILGLREAGVVEAKRINLF